MSEKERPQLIIGIAYDNLKTFSEERRKLLRFLLEDGDVLIASKGTVQKVAVFEDQGKREVVASSNITVLRPKEKLRGFYIKFFLETEIGRAYLDYAWILKFLRYRLLSKIIKLLPTYVGVPITTVRWFVQSRSGKISSKTLQKPYLGINKANKLRFVGLFFHSL